MKYIRSIVPLCALTLLLAGCGGGGSSSSGPSTTSATVAFKVISTAKLPVSIQGVSITAVLPAGVSVATDAGSNSISSSALSAGSGISSDAQHRLVYGTYSAAARKVKLTVATTEDTFRGGEFARLVVTYPSTVSLSLADFVAANAPAFPAYESAGYDLTAHTSWDLTDKTKASLGVTFN